MSWEEASQSDYDSYFGGGETIGGNTTPISSTPISSGGDGSAIGGDYITEGGYNVTEGKWSDPMLAAEMGGGEYLTPEGVSGYIGPSGVWYERESEVSPESAASYPNAGTMQPIGYLDPNTGQLMLVSGDIMRNEIMPMVEAYEASLLNGGTTEGGTTEGIKNDAKVFEWPSFEMPPSVVNFFYGADAPKTGNDDESGGMGSGLGLAVVAGLAVLLLTKV